MWLFDFENSLLLPLTVCHSTSWLPRSIFPFLPWSDSVYEAPVYEDSEPTSSHSTASRPWTFPPHPAAASQLRPRVSHTAPAAPRPAQRPLPPAGGAVAKAPPAAARPGAALGGLRGPLSSWRSRGVSSRAARRLFRRLRGKREFARILPSLQSSFTPKDMGDCVPLKKPRGAGQPLSSQVFLYVKNTKEKKRGGQ